MDRRTVAAVSVSGLIFSGCSFTTGDELFAAFTPPTETNALPADFWSRAKDSEDGRGSDVTIWLLPTWIDIAARNLDEDRTQLDDIAVTFANPGLLILPMLPLYVDVGVERFATDGTRARSAFTWTPFWAWSENEGKGPVEFTASGVPLLWGSVKARTTTSNLDLSIRHYLWSLASFYLSLGIDVEGSRVEGYAFAPVYLAGLGTNLWSSGAFHADFGEVVYHGPLDGWLGYRHMAGLSPEDAIAVDSAEDLFDTTELGTVLAEPGETRRFSRTNAAGFVPSSSLWLGGALWASWAESDTAGKEFDGRHGPLWTMFGYGTENGERTVVLFWWEF